MVALDHRGPSSITPLDRVSESVLDTRVDLELRDTAGRELALDRGDQRPHQALAAVRGVDEHREKTRAGFRPRRSGDRESDE
jgi:hypothetical protein